jgi:diguanylate cyclase (GGDEF)-like protein
MKLEIQPEIFDKFIDAICIVNEDLFPVYFNPSFATWLGVSSERAIRKSKISDLVKFESFDWDNLLNRAKESLESQVQEVKYSVNNSAGLLQVAWEKIDLEDGHFQIIFYLRDVSLEIELSRKYRQELTQKNDTIKALDEHIFQISLIKDILERATIDDDPMVMLQSVFSNLANVFQIDNILYLKEEEVGSSPVLKTFAGPVRLDERVVRAHVEKIVPELMFSDLGNREINGMYWLSFQSKDDRDRNRYFIFGKSTKFPLNEKNIIGTLCEPLTFSLDNRELFKKAITDEMTDLYNYRYFKLRLDKEMRAHDLANKKMGLLILDVDFFKKVNDTYGHLVGDIVLNTTARTLKNFCRTTDVPARYGGEEFALILQNIDEKDVFKFGDRLRQAIQNLEIEVPGLDHKVRITASIGISVYPVNAMTALDLIALADQCLYECKKTGRNKCIVSTAIRSSAA